MKKDPTFKELQNIIKNDGLRSPAIEWQTGNFRGERFTVHTRRGQVDIYRHPVEGSYDYQYDLRKRNSNDSQTNKIFCQTISKALKQEYGAENEQSLRNDILERRRQYTLAGIEHPSSAKHPLDDARTWHIAAVSVKRQRRAHVKEIGFKNLTEKDVIMCLYGLGNIPVQGDFLAPPERKDILPSRLRPSAGASR